jgi:hypothetical protein
MVCLVRRLPQLKKCWWFQPFQGKAFGALRIPLEKFKKLTRKEGNLSGYNQKNYRGMCQEIVLVFQNRRASGLQLDV